MSGHVTWITGLSGAGKTSVGVELSGRLRLEGRAVVMLDGDELRRLWGEERADPASYQREARVAFALRYARLADLIAAQGVDVVVATISLFKEIHIWNRLNIPKYTEIYLKVPVEELRRRDPKGIYRRYDVGEAHNVAGLDLSVDEPSDPDLTIDFEPARGVGQVVDLVMLFLTRKNVS